jgi:hypothetical protein
MHTAANQVGKTTAGLMLDETVRLGKVRLIVSDLNKRNSSGIDRSRNGSSSIGLVGSKLERGKTTRSPENTGQVALV